MMREQDHIVLCNDCMSVLQELPDGAVSLQLCSPPYEDARLYGMDFQLRGEDWVRWCFPRVAESVRVSDLSMWVMEGRTRDHAYSATPLLLAADTVRAGLTMRKPALYLRHGVPGSGGADWLKNNWEFVLAWTRQRGPLPWSDNTAMGHAPAWKPGGAPSNRKRNGDRVAPRQYVPPERSNPGNVILERPVADAGVACVVGGGRMGSDIAHENEAPFPLQLAEFMVRTFVPPGGWVLDIFAGSGTVAQAAVLTGRKSISIDVRESQCDAIRRRIAEAQVQLMRRGQDVAGA